MIIGISNVHTGDLVLPGVLLVGLFWGAYLGKRLIDLWIDSMRRQSTMDQHAADALRLARKEREPSQVFDPPEIAPEDEPYWPGKALHDSGARHLFALREQPIVVGGNPALFDVTGFAPASAAISTPPETAAETSGRHALTESMPAVVDDERAMAALAAVSSSDGVA